MSMSMSSPPPPLELLDEYWFFSNTLATNSSAAKKQKPPHPHLPRSPSKSTTATLTGGENKASSAPRRLLRTPSLPSSRGVGMRMELPMPTNKDEDGAGAAASANQPRRAADEVEDDDLNWSSIYEGVLRTRMAEGGGGTSALRRAPSMPESTPSSRRLLLRHSHTTLGRHTPKQVKQQQPEAEKKRTPSAVVARCSKNKKKQWKSSSDLESIEVQGFRDLGFVFDREELRESLANVLPGLEQQQTTKSSSQSTSPRRRPYLSEAWRPELVRAQSAAEIKDQLRMWAQAVACNVRQEC